MSDFIKHCFVCCTLIDEISFGYNVRDKRHLCSEECLDEYLNMSDAEFDICKKIYDKEQQNNT